MSFSTQLLQSSQGNKGGARAATPTGSMISGSQSTQLLQSVQAGSYKPISTPKPKPIAQPKAPEPKRDVFRELTERVKSIAQAPDYGRLKTAFTSSIKAMPGTMKIAGGVILDSWAQQQDFMNNFFQKAPGPLRNGLIGLPGQQISKMISQPLIQPAQKKGAEMRETGEVSRRKAVEPYAKLGPARGGAQTIAEALVFNVPQMALSTGLTIGTALVTKNPFAAGVVGLSTSYGLGSSEVYSSARSEGVSDKDALPLSILGGTVIGALDFVPLGRFIRKTGAVKEVEESIVKNIAKRIVSTGVQAGFEGVTEGLQEIVGNAIAKTYSEKRSLFENVGLSTIVGSIMGGGADVVVSGVVDVAGKNTPEKAIEHINKKIEEAANTPETKRTPEQQQLIQMLSEKVMTPEDAMAFVVDSDYENKPIGKKIVQTALQAQETGGNIRIKTGGEVDIVPTSSQELLTPKRSEPLTGILEEETGEVQREIRKVAVKDVETGLSEYITKNAKTDTPKIMEYTRVLEKGGTLEPIPVYEENGKYILNKDGFHRLQALKNAGRTDIEVRVEQKTDLSASAKQQAENKPKKNAAEAGLGDIGKIYRGVSDNTPNQVHLNKLGRGTYMTTNQKSAQRYAGETGQVLEMNPQTDVPQNPIKFKDDFEFFKYRNDLWKKYGKQDIETLIQKEGHDGVIVGSGDRMEIVKYKEPHVAQQPVGDTKTESEPEQVRMFDKKGNEITDKKVKVFNSSEARAVQEVVADQLTRAGTRADSQGALINEVNKIIDNAIDKANGERYALSGLRTALNKELFGAAGVTQTSDYKGNYAELKTVMNSDYPMSDYLNMLESRLIDVDNLLIKAEPKQGTKQATPVSKQITGEKPLKRQATGTGDSKEIPVGTGRQKASRLFERVKETLGEEYENSDVKYNVLDLEKQAQAVSDLIEQDPETAIMIARGFAEPPPGMTQNGVAIGLAHLATSQNDSKLAAEMWTKTSLRSTRLGQEIVSLRGEFGDASPMNAVKRIIDYRIDRVAKRYKTIAEKFNALDKSSSIAKVDAVIKDQAVRLKKKMTEQQKRIQSAQEIINALKCK